MQGIRKRARKVREEEKKERAKEEELLIVRTAKKKRTKPTDDAPPTKRKRTWRKTSHQKDIDSEAALELREATANAYKKATAEYEQAPADGKRKRGGEGSAATIAAKHNATLPDGAKRVTEMTIRNQVKAGRAGQSPTRQGPDRSLPKELFDTIASFIRMKQECGAEQHYKDLKRAIKAALKGTAWEKFAQDERQIQGIMKHVREDYADEISRANKVIIVMITDSRNGHG